MRVCLGEGLQGSAFDGSFGYMCTVDQIKGVCLEVQPAEDALEGVVVA